MVMTKIMGVVNVTPDSFYDGGHHNTAEQAIAQGLKLAEEGADYLDIGGESSRPGSSPVSLEEELDRIIPVIQSLSLQTSVPISIDTTKPEVARQALEAGATFLNDISGFRDPEMRDIAAACDADVCVMHMLGSPKTMQNNPYYRGGVVDDIIHWLELQIELLLDVGITEDRIIIDPGIGFGKTVAHNLQIIQNLEKFKELGFPVLLGLSRKTFIRRLVDKPADAAEVLASTIAINALAMQCGADIIRVHDVREHKHAIEVMETS